jgi:hypothetical protein
MWDKDAQRKGNGMITAEDIRSLYEYHFTLNRWLWDTSIMALTDEQFTHKLGYSVENPMRYHHRDTEDTEIIRRGCRFSEQTQTRQRKTEEKLTGKARNSTLVLFQKGAERWRDCSI